MTLIFLFQMTKYKITVEHMQRSIAVANVLYPLMNSNITISYSK